MVPPFGIVARVMAHLKACKAQGTLVIPFWPKQAWWSVVRSPDGANWCTMVVESVRLPSTLDMVVYRGSRYKRLPAPRWQLYALRVDGRL